MRIAVSSDMHTHLVPFILEELERRGHTVAYFGPTSPDHEEDWPVVTTQAIGEIKSQVADEALVMCWTGTGCTIAANKIDGIRAALCHDAETAKGARIWNHANVLALSLRKTTEAVAKEILDAWFATPFSEDDWNRTQIARIDALERTPSAYASE